MGLLSLLLGFAAVGCNSGEPEDPLATLRAQQTATVTTTEATPEQAALAEAEAAYRRHVALLDELGRLPGDKELLARLAETSTGVDKATAETEYGVLWVDRGWRMSSGASKVRSVRLAKAQLDADPPQLTIRTCLDATAAIVVDRRGKQVRKPGTPAMANELVIVVKEPNGNWLVSHTLENELVNEC